MRKATKPPYLTKSRYINALTCKKWLWLGWHDPTPYEDPAIGSIQEVGTRIGVHAQGLFPNGVLVDEAPWEHQKAVSRTAALMVDGQVPAIYEAAFEFAEIRVRVDILERLSDGSWGIREVKSSTSVKEDHLHDMAVQAFVLQGCGLSIASIELIHVNNHYVFEGGEIDWSSFFVRADRTEETLDLLSDIEDRTVEFLKVLSSSSAPEIAPGPHCSGYCDYWDHCTANKPGDEWVFNLPRLRKEKFYELEAMGIDRISDIPDDFSLNATQEIVRQSWIAQKDFISPDLHKGLRGFGPPAFYLDFETMSPAIPVFVGTRPFERQPFQWSLHLDDGSGYLMHSDFLADHASDPRRAFAETLIGACGESDIPILVYSSFEASVIRSLEALYPDLKASLQSLGRRLRDLLAVTRNYTYFRAYGGSFSIKRVAPALAPSIRYDGLEAISDGGAASAAYTNLVAGLISDTAEVSELRKALLEYCKLDTLAMVEVHRALLKLS